MLGPGKYDQECTLVRERTQAAGVVVLVLNGERGSGFSVQAPLRVHAVLPDLLENMASEIRQRIAAGEL